MATVQEFDLLQKSAVTDIQADLEAAVEADRIAAQVARTGAETAKTNAETAEALAEKWAENNEDAAVETGKFSAKHYSIKAAAQNAQMQAVYPTAAYRSRVLTDSGSIQDLSKLTELYIKNLQLLDSTVFLWSGVSGMKTRTSGSNQFASKLYNMANKVQQFGSELVTNGTFTTNTDNWIPSGGATLSVDTARLKITNTAGTNGGATQAIATEVNKTYHLTYTFTLGAGNGQVRVGTTLGGSQLLLSPVLSANATRTVSFVATGTTTYFFFGCDSMVSTDFAIYDTISVRQMDWVEGTNDAVQTTEANQSYVGGVIAPNEVRKLKSYTGNNNTLPFSSAITFAANEDRTFTIIADIDVYGTDQSFLSFSSAGNTNYFNLTKTIVRYVIAGSYTPTTIRLTTYKKALITVVYRNGNVSIYENGVLIGSSTIPPNQVVFNMIAKLYPSTGHILEHFQIFNRALSASEIQAQHDYLRLQIPEIEGVAIGNQYWATSNYEGVAAGDSSVIPEVQNSDNVDKSSAVPWTIISAAGSTGSVSGNTLISTNSTTGYPRFQKGGLTPGKWYKVSVALSGDVAAIGQIRLSDGGGSNNVPKINSNLYEGYVISAKTMLEIATNSVYSSPYTITVDSLVLEEVGWSQSTVLYDAIYAQTSGTPAQKELAALKAAAMWCYHSNDVNNGAIYGKLYNWYAVKLISLYPPTGYRVPTSADFTQLQNYLGGGTVAGGKMKKEGLTYWASPNTGATNESGFSNIGSGYRLANGGFSQINLTGGSWTPDKFICFNEYNSTSLVSTDVSLLSLLTVGRSLRLLRNSPVGSNETTVTTGTIVNALGAGNLDIVIPFGYAVDSIKVISKTGITGLSAKYCSRNPSTLVVTELDTLFTAKTVVADTPKLFNCNVDQTIQQQDAVVRINGTKADTAAEFEVRVNIKKAIL